MTIRRWAALLTLLAVWTVQASGLPVLAGEITPSAAKVFLTAAKADEKSTTATPAVAPIPAAIPTPATAVAAPSLGVSLDAHSAAAVPPTLDDSAKQAAPNVLKPTVAQQEARVTPTSDDASSAGSRSSRRAPTLLPLPSLGVSQTTDAPTLAPPNPLAPAAAPLLIADKSTAPQELKPALTAPAVTNKIEASTPNGDAESAAPALLTPATSALPAVSTPIPTSTGLIPMPSSAAAQAPAPADDHPVGYDPVTGKTYRNVLRSNPTTAPSVAAKPQVIELTPSFAPTAKSTTPSVATPTPAVTAPTTVQSKPQTFSSRPSIATDAPISRPAPSHAPAATRPNTMLSPGDEAPTQRAVVAKTPAQPESKKMFESQEQLAPLTSEQEALRRRVQQSLATFYQNWTLNTREHSPWEVMHAIIAYGVDTRLETGNGTTTAIGHLCFSGVSNKQQIVTVTRNGRLYMNRGPGVQGHAGQFLAIVAQSQLQRDYPLYAGGKEFTMEDLIKAEQFDCESGTELTFKLIGLMHYLPSDAEWTNFQGQKWSMDRLVREEIVQPIRGAACGGTHRLMGLSYAVRKREQRGEPITGIYKEAEKYIAQYHKYTRGLQNPDGSFSTAWFVRREARLDLDRRLQTTGHVLEWLCFSLNDEQLREPWVTKTVTYVTNLLLDEHHEWEIGHLGHALHALQMYNERMYGGPIRSYEGMVSRRPIKTAKQATPGLHNQ